MLERLRSLLNQRGRLSKRLIDKTEDMPCAQLYQERFGGLRNAYELIGYRPESSFGYIEAHRRLRAARNEVAAEALTEIRNVGGFGYFVPKTSILTINSEFSASILTIRCTPTRAKYPSWRIKMNDCPGLDTVIVARMDERALRIVDYFMLPSKSTKRVILLDRRNALALESHRFYTLNSLFGLNRDAFKKLIGSTAAGVQCGLIDERRLGTCASPALESI